MSTGTVLLIYLLLDRFEEPLVVRTAAFLAAIYPTSVMATNLLGTETIFTFCLLLLAFLIASWEEESILHLALLGFLITWTAIVRSMLAVLYFSVASTFLSRDTPRKAVRSLLFLSFFIILGLSPWAIRNWNVFHRFIPVCTSEGEFLGRHTGYLLAGDTAHLEQMPRYQAWRAIPNEAERSSLGYHMALANWVDIIRQGPLTILKAFHTATYSTFYADDEILFWSVTRSYGRARHSGAAQALSLPMISHGRWLTLGFYLAVLVLSGMAILTHAASAKGFYDELFFLKASFFLFFCTNLIVLSKVRYHFGMMPLLLIFAAKSSKRFELS